MSDSRSGASDAAPAHGDAARWARIENGVREDAAHLAVLVLDGLAESHEAKALARRIDSVRTEGIGAEY